MLVAAVTLPLCLPYHSHLFLLLYQYIHSIWVHLKFHSCLRLRFPDDETNPGPPRSVPASCRILCSNVRGLSGNLSDLAVASSQYDILLCSETLVSDLRHVSELLVPGFGRPVFLCRGMLPRTRGIAAYVQDGYGAFRQPKF